VGGLKARAKNACGLRALVFFGLSNEFLSVLFDICCRIVVKFAIMDRHAFLFHICESRNKEVHTSLMGVNDIICTFTLKPFGILKVWNVMPKCVQPQVLHYLLTW